MAKLYRLLRDDENPLEDGISARRPLADDPPALHIRHGSRRSSQWISTSRELSAINKLIEFKRKKEGWDVKCRVVVIDEQKLQEYAKACKSVKERLRRLIMGKENHREATTLVELFFKMATRDILDFTDSAVMDKHIPFNPAKPQQNEWARGCARKYREVLVKGHIPAECCITIYNS